MWSWYSTPKVEASGTVLLYHLSPVTKGSVVTKEWLELNFRYLSQYFNYHFDKIFLLCTDETQKQFAENFATYHTRMLTDARFPSNNTVFKGTVVSLYGASLAELFRKSELADPQYVYLYWSSQVAYFNSKHASPMEFFKGMSKADPARLIVPSQYGTGLTDRLMLNQEGLIKDLESFEQIRTQGKLTDKDHYFLHREFFQRLLANAEIELPEKTIKSETFRHQFCPGVMIYTGDLISKTLVEADNDDNLYQKLGNMHLTMTMCSLACRYSLADSFVEQGYQRIIKPVTRNNMLTYLRMLSTTFVTTATMENTLAASMVLQTGHLPMTTNQSETKKLVELYNKYYANLGENVPITWMGLDSDNMIQKLFECKIDPRVRLIKGISDLHLQTTLSCFKSAKFDCLLFNDANMEQLDQIFKLGLAKPATRIVVVSKQGLFGKVAPTDLPLIRAFYKETCITGLTLQPIEVTDTRIVFSLVNYKENPVSSLSL